MLDCIAAGRQRVPELNNPAAQWADLVLRLNHVENALPVATGLLWPGSMRLEQ
jgi:hypothetical protein